MYIGTTLKAHGFLYTLQASNFTLKIFSHMVPETIHNNAHNNGGGGRRQSKCRENGYINHSVDI